MADLGLSRGTLAVPNEKAGPISARSAKRAGLDFLEVPEPHQIAAMSASRWQSARGLMCLSKPAAKTYFFLLVFFAFFAFFAFLAFLAMLPSATPVGSMQVDIDMHKMKSTPQFEN